MKLNIDKKTIISVLGAAIILVFFAWGLNNLQTVSQFFSNIVNVCAPLILGCVIAFILNLPMSFFEKKVMVNAKKPSVIKLRRALGILISLIIIFAVLAFVIILVMPEIGNAFVLLAQGIAEILPQIAHWANVTLSENQSVQDIIAGLNMQWSEIANEAINYVTSSVSTVLGSAVGIVSLIAGGITNFVFALIFAIYILMAKEQLKLQMHSLFELLLPGKLFKITSYIARMAKLTFSNFIVGQCAEALILGALSFIGMTIFGFPYASTISVLIGALALIPIVGAFLGAFVGAFLILTVNPVQAVWYLVFSIALQQVEGNLIYPKVVGGSIGLPGMWVLAAVTVGGSLWGILGMLVMVPLFSILYALVKLMVKAGKRRKEMLHDEVQNPKQAGSALLDAIIELEKEEQNNKAQKTNAKKLPQKKKNNEKQQ